MKLGSGAKWAGVVVVALAIAGALIYVSVDSGRAQALFPNRAAAPSAGDFAGDQYFHPVSIDVGCSPATPEGDMLGIEARLRRMGMSAASTESYLSPAEVESQIPRVAQARGLGQEQVRALVRRYTAFQADCVPAGPRVNVVKIDLALDASN